MWSESRPGHEASFMSSCLPLLFINLTYSNTVQFVGVGGFVRESLGRCVLVCVGTCVCVGACVCISQCVCVFVFIYGPVCVCVYEQICV